MSYCFIHSEFEGGRKVTRGRSSKLRTEHSCRFVGGVRGACFLL